MNRQEFGVRRTSCACEACKVYCRHMPGHLLPSDLGRMIPANVDPFVWAENNLLASLGATVQNGREKFHIHTLVPASRDDGACIYLGQGGECTIHDIAPFGCAFFGCGPEAPGFSIAGLSVIYEEFLRGGLYARLWKHLYDLGRTRASAEVLRARMSEALRRTTVSEESVGKAKNPSPELRVVLNQIGAFIELHGYADAPIHIGRLSDQRLAEYRNRLIAKNPNMQYMSIGQVASGVAEELFASLKETCPGLTLNPHIWQYNASTDTYDRA